MGLEPLKGGLKSVVVEVNLEPELTRFVGIIVL